MARVPQQGRNAVVPATAGRHGLIRPENLRISHFLWVEQCHKPAIWAVEDWEG